MKCLKFLYSKNAITELVIAAAIVFLVIVLLESTLPLSNTIIKCRNTRRCFTTTDNIVYISDRTATDFSIDGGSGFDCLSIDIPFSGEQSFITTALYSITTNFKLNDPESTYSINVIRYSDYDWSLLNSQYLPVEKDLKSNDSVGLIVSKSAAERFNYSIGDRFGADVWLSYEMTDPDRQIFFYIVGIIPDRQAFLYVSQCQSTQINVGHLCVSQKEYLDSDKWFALAIDPGNLLPEDKNEKKAALLSVPDDYNIDELVDGLNAKYGNVAEFEELNAIFTASIRKSWASDRFALLLLILFSIVTITCYVGFVYTKVDNMRETNKALYINGISGVKLILMYLAYFNSLLVPSYAIALLLFPAISGNAFYGYNILVISACLGLLILFVGIALIPAILSVRKNSVIIYNRI